MVYCCNWERASPNQDAFGGYRDQTTECKQLPRWRCYHSSQARSTSPTQLCSSNNTCLARYASGITDWHGELLWIAAHWKSRDQKTSPCEEIWCFIHFNFNYLIATSINNLFSLLCCCLVKWYMDLLISYYVSVDITIQVLRILDMNFIIVQTWSIF